MRIIPPGWRRGGISVPTSAGAGPPLEDPSFQLLLESGDVLLLESGDALLLEAA